LSKFSDNVLLEAEQSSNICRDTKENIRR